MANSVNDNTRYKADAVGAKELMLAANRKLGAADLDAILALTANPPPSTGPVGMSVNAAKTVNGGGMVTYDGRMVDKDEAVRFAEVWSNFITPSTSPRPVIEASGDGRYKAIADNSWTETTVRVGSLATVSHVDLVIALNHQRPSDLRIELVSPSGTKAVALEAAPSTANEPGGSVVYRLGVDNFFGEASRGDWKVRITDTRTGATGTVQDVRLELYGEANTANDVYHYTREFFSEATQRPVAKTLVDTDGGIDWVNLSSQVKDVKLDLGVDAVTTVGGKEIFKIGYSGRPISSDYPNELIENAVTGDGNDVLKGNAAANKLLGMRGNDTFIGDAGGDTLDGGDGIDSVSYAESGAGVDVDLSRATQLGGFAAGDVLISIENVTGSSFADRLVGNAGANALYGLGGDDILAGGAGKDLLDGGTGKDTVTYAASDAGVNLNLSSTGAQEGGHAQGDVLVSIENIVGSRFADRIVGNDQDNVIEGGAGGDVLYGGGGFDTASYETSKAGVVLNLATGVHTGGDATGDRLFGFEAYIGSAFADRMTGSDASEQMYGGDGNDIFYGSGGADVLDGGKGVDGVVYSTSGSGVSVNLLTGLASGGHAQGDKLTAIENVTGSNYADTIVGDGFANRLEGGAGNDFLDGGKGADILIGGIGSDRLTGGVGADTFVFQKIGFGNDVITDFNVAEGDKIDLSGTGLRFSDLTFTATSGGEIIGTGGQDTIFLAGHSNPLAAGDFLFA